MYTTTRSSRRPRGGIRLGTASLLSLLLACDGGKESPTSSPDGVDPSPTSKLAPYTLEQEGPPLAVSVQLDSAKSVSATVPTTGGGVSATAADGTTYVLDVPGNALESDTRITLTPVAKLSDLPFGTTGTTTIGVQMEPQGLRFLSPASLTITPSSASGIPLEQQLFFQWEGKGDVLSLAAPDPKSRAIKLSVLHFSGMGVVRSKGLDADIEPVRKRIGGDAEGRIQSAIAEALQRQRQAALSGVPDGETRGILDVLPAMLDRFHKEVVVPRNAAAASSCAAGRLAILTMLGIERQRQLLGFGESGYMDDILRLIPVVAEVCMKEEFEICRDEHVITKVLPARLGLERMAQLLGFQEGSLASLDKYVTGCLRFEVDFLSTAGHRGESFDSDEGVQALKARVAWNPSDWQIRSAGEVPLQSMYVDVRSKDKCLTVVEPTRVGSTFEVTALSFTPNGEDVQDFRLDFSAGLTESNFKVRDDCSDPPQTSPQALELNHGNSYGPTRAITADNILEPFVVREWTVRKDRVMATKTERVTYQIDGSTSLYYDDRWEIRHVPSL